MAVCRQRLIPTVLIIVVVLYAAPSPAGTVVIFNTAGPRGRNITPLLAESLTIELVEHHIVGRLRPRSWRKIGRSMAHRIATAVRSTGADAGIASMVTGSRERKLFILVVSKSGEILLGEAFRLPAWDFQRRVSRIGRKAAAAVSVTLDVVDLERGAARYGRHWTSEPSPVDLDLEINDDAPQRSHDHGRPRQRESMEDRKARLDIDIIEDEVALARESVELVAYRSPATRGAVIDLDATLEAEVPATASEGDPIQVIGHLGGGFTGYHDEIRSGIPTADIDIKANRCPSGEGGLELALGRLLLMSMVARHQRSILRRASTEGTGLSVHPAAIETSAWGFTGLLGSSLELGPLVAGVYMGLAYDSLEASRQSVRTSDGEPSWPRTGKRPLSSPNTSPRHF